MTSLWDQIKDWVLLGGLIAVSLAAMFTQNQSLTRAARAGSLQLTAQVESAFAWVGSYFRALEENSQLRRENIALSSEVARSREARIENARLEEMLNLRDTTDLELQPARITTKSLTQQRNFFTINAGSEDSVKAGMPVIDDRGILGKIILVSDSYARVMPYLNTDFRVPAKIQSLGAEGIVRWEGDRRDRLLLEHIVRTEAALRGQQVVTSGHSGVFPAGLPVGFIDSLAARQGRNEYRIFLTPSSPLSKAQHVFVVLTEPDEERLPLEQPL